MKPLEFEFRSYLEEVTYIEGELLTIRSAIREFNEKHSFKSWTRLIEGTSSYRDLRIRGNNLKLSEFRTEVNTHNLQETFERIESRESMFALSQVYEVFEGYLKRILQVFFELNPSLSSRLGKYEQLFIQNEKNGAFIKQMQRKDRNNKKLLWIVRKISKSYEKIEKENSSKIQLNIWFDLTSDIRHTIVHNRFKASNIFKSRLKENNKLKYFEIAYVINNQSIITTNRLKIERQISLLNSMAFLIMECLKKENSNTR
ncbi:hypothetical protein Q4534_15200 [Cyclobacterium sp. 1_MG-2023]|uniref:hypothetical protein n=1 Tax=Cyclobacterium sp. 1_MG-2023 TaxID=3062681 RepID=UPI0026E27022|nr:hypothetical protein [Cyclobacterium sp. 1_MG-2023]MDO6438769.1 hypothetical protein [Cyclobacterium sp. 1_MG-2023]